MKSNINILNRAEVKLILLNINKERSGKIFGHQGYWGINCLWRIYSKNKRQTEEGIYRGNYKTS